MKVPPRILSLAEYGGLNVHPSILPDLRGAAPIHHTLLARESHTGVSVQTLHPTKIDHGKIVLQKRNIPIPNPDTCTPKELIDYLAPIGGNLLVQALRERLYLPLNQTISQEPVPENQRLAPKITKEDRHVNWETWTASNILNRNRVLGDLWDTSTWSQCAASPNISKRVIFHALKPLQNKLLNKRGGPGTVYLTGGTLAIRTAKGPGSDDVGAVEVVSCTLEGGKKGKGDRELVSVLKRRIEGGGSK